MVVQCLLNGCFIVIEWLFNGSSMADVFSSVVHGYSMRFDGRCCSMGFNGIYLWDWIIPWSVDGALLLMVFKWFLDGICILVSQSNWWFQVVFMLQKMIFGMLIQHDWYLDMGGWNHQEAEPTKGRFRDLLLQPKKGNPQISVPAGGCKFGIRIRCVSFCFL